MAHKRKPVAVTLASGTTCWFLRSIDVDVDLIDRDWAKRLVLRIKGSSRAVRFADAAGSRYIGYDSINSYEHVGWDLSGLDKEDKEEGTVKVETVDELRKRTMLYVLKRSDPGAHVVGLYAAGFFGEIGLEPATQVLDKYIQGAGGCKRDEARRELGLITTEKLWVKKTLTGREVAQLIDGGTEVRFNTPTRRVDNGSKVGSPNYEAAKRLAFTQLIVHVLEEVEV